MKESHEAGRCTVNWTGDSPVDWTGDSGKAMKEPMKLYPNPVPSDILGYLNPLLPPNFLNILVYRQAILQINLALPSLLVSRVWVLAFVITQVLHIIYYKIYTSYILSIHIAISIVLNIMHPKKKHTQNIRDYLPASGMAFEENLDIFIP